MTIEGIVCDRTCDACPTQYEGQIDGNPFYFRARYGWWALTVVRPGADPVWPKDATSLVMYWAERMIDEADDSGFNGYMDHDAVVVELVRARDILRKEANGPKERK